MKIRKLLIDDIETCSKLLIATYNPSPWNNHWTEETAKRYLLEFTSNDRFIGFVIEENDQIVGAMFAHRKVWWTNDEIFIDELFIHPDQQGRGYGQLLMEKVEELSKELGLGGVTLLTNSHLPAKLFYENKGYVVAENIVFMYKEIQ